MIYKKRYGRSREKKGKEGEREREWGVGNSLINPLFVQQMNSWS